jgi:GNAT superfamily N-acetyltransferase
VPVPSSRGTTLLPLTPAQAYLFDMYVAPRYRGLRLAPLLRRRILRELADAGRSHCYSLSLAGNRSTRRFKARLGAREVELRIYVHLRLGSLPGLDLRLWRGGERTAAPRFKRVRAAASPSSAASPAHAGGGTAGARHDV